MPFSAGQFSRIWIKISRSTVSKCVYILNFLSHYRARFRLKIKEAIRRDEKRWIKIIENVIFSNIRRIGTFVYLGPMHCSEKREFYSSLGESGPSDLGN
uniref:Uncharacterized protein n=1 Tax=Romanomermis culicivorax TaxID=13658 RepID=A0A915KUU1_ROMCU